jgi:hypothetical protein
MRHLHSMFVREIAILVGLSLATLVLTYPLSINPDTMVPEPSDPLLSAWRMHWVKHFILAGADGTSVPPPRGEVHRLFDANIFYPYPMTLAFSEHFLAGAALALPVLLAADSHLLGANLSVLASFVLTAYATYLLISDWTKNRVAGLFAGFLLAFSPFRFGQINHLELLFTQWIPSTLLALRWVLVGSRESGDKAPYSPRSVPTPFFGGRRAVSLVLFVLFFNLQALSSVYYTVYLVLACVVLVAVSGLAGRIRWGWDLLVSLCIFGAVTFALNWPLWRTYLDFSEVMGAVRTPGDVRVYSAALTDYLTTIPNNLLYGWTFGRWQSAGHQFQPLMPVGIAGLVLAVLGVVRLFCGSPLFSQGGCRFLTRIGRIQRMGTDVFPPGPLRKSNGSNIERASGVFLIAIVLIAFVLSLGTNEEAFGSALAPALSRLLPYGWLYDHVPGFMGLRVPARSAVLVALGLAGLAGYGLAALQVDGVRRQETGDGSQETGDRRQGSYLPTPVFRLPLLKVAAPAMLSLAAVVECWSVPLAGPQFPYGQSLPPVYDWLRNNTKPDSVVLELPQEGASEFAYEFFSTYHWRRLVNGGSGYTPAAHRELRGWFKTFPDWRSVDILQQIGVDYVVLHQPEFTSDSWKQIQSQLPGFLSAFDEIHPVGTSLMLHVAGAQCPVDKSAVAAGLSLSPDDQGAAPSPPDSTGTTRQQGTTAAVVALRNDGAATFVADVSHPSWVSINGQEVRQFFEPLVVPPNETRTTQILLPENLDRGDSVEAHLHTLGSVLTPGPLPPPVSTIAADRPPQQPLRLTFVEGPQLLGYTMAPEALQVCGVMKLMLYWQTGVADDTAVAQLVDRFGRVVMESRTHPWRDPLAKTGDYRSTRAVPDSHLLPLPGSLPAGEYGLRVKVMSTRGDDRPIVNDQGSVIDTNQLPALPVIIRPMPVSLPVEAAPLATFAGGIELVGAHLPEGDIIPGSWLRFSLIWRARSHIKQDLTVFTQLIGPDGKVWGQQDNPPRGGWYPVHLWQPGEVVQDEFALQVDAQAPAGTYQLVAGLYDSQTVSRLNLQTAQGETTDHVVLGECKINPSE